MYGLLKKMSSINQSSPTIMEIEKSLVKTVAEALQLQYKNFDLKRENVVNAIYELANYVYKAHKDGLEQREQCSYSGSILVFASLEEMGEKYASDVDVVNAVYLAGSKMANALWAKLDSLQKSETKLDYQAFEEMISTISNEIWLQFYIHDGER
jgi:hypothetical protein